MIKQRKRAAARYKINEQTCEKVESRAEDL